MIKINGETLIIPISNKFLFPSPRAKAGEIASDIMISDRKK